MLLLEEYCYNVYLLISYSRHVANCSLAHTRFSHSLSPYAYRSRPSLKSRDLPGQVQALAILLPKRGYATETTTHGGESGPPPGFNINEAKKPPPKEQAKKAAQTPTVTGLKKAGELIETPQTSATFSDKTAASEKASLSELAASKTKGSEKSEEKAVAAKKDEPKKLTLGQKIKKEIAHYWDGTKLLATEVRISSKLALKMAAGYELSRRENRQVWRFRASYCFIANMFLAPTYCPRSWTTSTLLCLRHCPFRRITPSGRAEIIPKHASVDI